jgi:hypothetical protein
MSRSSFVDATAVRRRRFDADSPVLLARLSPGRR